MELFPSFDLDGEVLNDGTDGGNHRNRPGEWRGRGGEVEVDLIDPGPPRLDSVGGKREEIAADLAVVFDPCGDDQDDTGEFGNRGDYGGSSVGRESETRGSRGGGMECGAGEIGRAHV